MSVDIINEGVLVLALGGQREVQLVDLATNAVVMRHASSDNVSCVKTVGYKNKAVLVFGTFDGRLNYLM